jgi:hypothetical protein
MRKTIIAIIILVLGLAYGVKDKGNIVGQGFSLANEQLAADLTIPKSINFQGYLYRDGNPMDTIMNMWFGIYDTPTSGTQLFQQTVNNVTVTKGWFTISLDNIPNSVFPVTGPTRYLEVKAPATGPALSPRISLVSVGYSYHSITADSAEYAKAAPLSRPITPPVYSTEIRDTTITTAKIKDGAITSSKILDGTISGIDIAKPCTLTATADWPNSILQIKNNGSGNGIKIDSAGTYGIYVDKVGFAGVEVYRSNQAGVYVYRARVDGVWVDSAGSNGVYVNRAGSNGLLVSYAPDCGVRVDSSAVLGIDIRRAGATGVNIRRTGTGVYVDTASSAGIRVRRGSQGVRIDTVNFEGVSIKRAGTDGLNIMSAAQSGAYVTRAGSSGYYVDSANYGFNVNRAARNGVNVSRTGWNGIQIDTAVRNGVSITRADSNGLRIRHAGFRGVHIDTTMNDGINIGKTGTSGIFIDKAGSQGIWIDSAHNDGIYVWETGASGLFIGRAGSQGVWVDRANGFGVYVRRAGSNGVYVDSAGAEAIYCKGQSDNWTIKGESYSEGAGILGIAHGYTNVGVKGYADRGCGVFAVTDTMYNSAAVLQNNWGSSYPGLIVYGTSIFNGAKSGFVTDVCVNDGPDKLEPGDVVVISGYAPAIIGEIPVIKVRKANQANMSGVVGIVDSRQIYNPEGAKLTRDPAPTKAPPVIIHYSEGSVDASEYLMVVTLGSYKQVKVDASYGPIRPGDILVSSPTPGYAMKSDSPKTGTVIGKALSSLETGKGKIPIMVMLQ